MLDPFLFARFSVVILIFSNQPLTDPVASIFSLGFRKERHYIYVICRLGGPYWKKLWQRS